MKTGFCPNETKMVRGARIAPVFINIVSVMGRLRTLLLYLKEKKQKNKLFNNKCRVNITSAFLHIPVSVLSSFSDLSLASFNAQALSSFGLKPVFIHARCAELSLALLTMYDIII